MQMDLYRIAASGLKIVILYLTLVGCHHDDPPVPQVPSEKEGAHIPLTRKKLIY